MRYITLVVFAITLGLITGCAYRDTGSPQCALRIVDQEGKPIAGLKVEREWKWDGSDNHKGRDEAVTDRDGRVSFQKVIINRYVITRIFKPLLIFVPAPCGPEWEIYTMTEFIIPWSGAYDLKFPPSDYKHVYAVYEDKNGTCITDPKEIEKWLRTFKKDLSQNYIRIHFFNRKNDCDFTLMVYKKIEG